MLTLSVSVGFSILSRPLRIFLAALPTHSASSVRGSPLAKNILSGFNKIRGEDTPRCEALKMLKILFRKLQRIFNIYNAPHLPPYRYQGCDIIKQKVYFLGIATKRGKRKTPARAFTVTNTVNAPARERSSAGHTQVVQ